MPAILTFDGIEDQLDVYRREDCLKKFCESSKEKQMKIANFERKKMLPLTKEEYESYVN